MFLDVLLMKIECGLVQFDVKAGVAGKPSTRIIDDFVGLKIVEEYSCVGVGDAEVSAEGRLMPLRMMSACLPRPFRLATTMSKRTRQ